TLYFHKLYASEEVIQNGSVLVCFAEETDQLFHDNVLYTKSYYSMHLIKTVDIMSYAT
ncbi:unnamed protein product, partial [Heterobilharzia americana]